MTARDKIFYLACFGFGAGVLWRSFLLVGWQTIFFIGLLYLLAVLFCVLIFKKPWEVFVSVAALAFLLGVFRFQVAATPAPPVFEMLVGKNVSISGLIVDEPDKSDNGVKLIVETEAKTSQTGIVIFAKTDDGYKYGDEIGISGVLEKPKNFMTDQGLEFDYVNYLRKDGIFYDMRNPKISFISGGHGNFIKRLLFAIKERFEAAIKTALPPPESTVLDGIILGERGAFSQSLRQSFMDTGTIHLVTIGGYHVTLVAQWIMKLLGFLPKAAGVAGGLIGIFLYIIVTGGAQTSIRAGIMASLALFAGVTGRNYIAGRALVLAATIMVLINPFVLAYDISFELSFMATIAVIFLSPKIEPYFEWITKKWLREIVAITSSMYVFALPFVLYRMGSLSLVALPANILLVPFLPITMIAGFVTGFAGLISPILAILPSKATFTLLYYQISAIGTLAHLPFAAVTIPYFPLTLVIVVYSIFIWIFVTGYEQQETVPATRHLGTPAPERSLRRLLIITSPLILTLCAAGFFYYSHQQSNLTEKTNLQKIIDTAAAANTKNSGIFEPDEKTLTSNCRVQGPLPDHACTPGAIFENATVAQICVKGYTKTVRNVSTNLRKQVFAEYGIPYPQPTGAYEVDHLVPLALGGANDIANLFPEAASPTPGFHEKDIVEVFLQQEVCSGLAPLSGAQRQIATDWLAVYDNIPFEDKLAIQKKYGSATNE